MIIDIRNSTSYLKGHIENAKNIPFSKLYFHPDEYLDKQKTYYLYCDTGHRSKLLVSYLKSLGFKCVNIEGGYSKYLFK